jgi:uncharacterized peroxidase-related enzyme
MPHINLPEGLPGILGPMSAYPETERELKGLAQALLRGPSSLTPASREMMATLVSAANDCDFCTQSHAAAARELYGAKRKIVDLIIEDPESSPLSEKLKALVAIAEKVRQGGKLVTPADIQRARAAGADDKAIHDAVLIAAAFCMFNRYVDGLATWAPSNPEAYLEMGLKLANEGYVSNESTVH